jgi:hypothetical protein
MPYTKHFRLTTLALILIGVSTGCTTTADIAPEPEVSSSAEPTYFPSGSASRNLPVFESVLQESGAGKPGHEISATVSLLVKTGFNIEAMTHTQLETKIGQPAESVSLAVAVQGQCLIAQFSSTWLTTKVADETASGCLIGDVEQASQLNN